MVVFCCCAGLHTAYLPVRYLPARVLSAASSCACSSRCLAAWPGWPPWPVSCWRSLPVTEARHRTDRVRIARARAGTTRTDQLQNLHRSARCDVVLDQPPRARRKHKGRRNEGARKRKSMAAAAAELSVAPTRGLFGNEKSSQLLKAQKRRGANLAVRCSLQPQQRRRHDVLAEPIMNRITIQVSSYACGGRQHTSPGRSTPAALADTRSLRTIAEGRRGTRESCGGFGGAERGGSTCL